MTLAQFIDARILESIKAALLDLRSQRAWSEVAEQPLFDQVPPIFALAGAKPNFGCQNDVTICGRTTRLARRPAEWSVANVVVEGLNW
jgi:hypothetical protein